ncbi:MAG: hypothetical protein ABIH66_05450 [bacterium]
MSNKDDGTISVCLNMLMIPAFKMQKSCNYEDILRDLYGNRGGSSTNLIEEIKSNHDEVSSNDYEMSFVPPQQPVIDKIVLPLFSAKTNYCLANYLACIAMCGLACEMTIIFIYDLIHAQCDMKLIEKFISKFGDYEEWNHGRRIKNLKKLKNQYKSFGKELKRELKLFFELLNKYPILDNSKTVMDLRRKYLHFISADHGNLKADALETYNATFQLVKSAVALELHIGSAGVSIPDHLTKLCDSDS